VRAGAQAGHHFRRPLRRPLVQQGGQEDRLPDPLHPGRPPGGPRKAAGGDPGPQPQGWGGLHRRGRRQPPEPGRPDRHRHGERGALRGEAAHLPWPGRRARRGDRAARRVHGRPRPARGLLLPGHRAPPGPGRRGDRVPQDGRHPPRHRQDRHRGPDPQQAGPPRRRRGAAHAGAHRHRRPDPRRRSDAPGPGAGRPAPPRAIRRQGLPRRPGGRGDPSGGAHHQRGRHLRRHDQHAALPEGYDLLKKIKM